MAWCELFANLYELKSRIWLREEYNHFARIYRVYRLIDFRQSIPGIMTNDNVSGDVNIRNIFPTTRVHVCIYTTRLAYFLATPTLDADI